MNKKIPKVIIADGVVTNRKDLCLGILTADCAPIVVFGKKNFGIVHVGWKGAFSDIIKNTVKTFISKGETNDDLNFFIGPHIKGKIIELGISKIRISRIDTFRNFRNFFSYRYYTKKGINNCGRQISLVCFK